MEDLRRALRAWARPVNVITSLHEGRRYAMTATAVSELSLDPPAMIVCVNQSASMHLPLDAGAAFCINILSADQTDIAAICGGRVTGEARFADGAFDADTDEVPVLKGALASIHCRVCDRLSFGSHTAFVGAVDNVVLNEAPAPLVYFDGRFRMVGTECA